MWRSAVQVCLGLHIAARQCAPTVQILGLHIAARQCAPTVQILGLRASGGLAQLARAPALQAGGQRFESVILHSVCENADRRSQSAIVRNGREIFDILTHKTVSKTLSV